MFVLGQQMQPRLDVGIVPLVHRLCSLEEMLPHLEVALRRGQYARQRMADTGPQAVDGANAFARPESFPRFMADAFAKVAPDFAAELHDLSIAVGPAPFLRDLRACDEFDVIDRLGEIDVPTAVIAAERDTFTPPELARRMAEMLPDSEFFMLKNGSHAAPIEQPDVITERVKSFLREKLGTRA